MCSGLRPDAVSSIGVFMLVDMLMLCFVQLVPDFGPMQLVRTSVRCRGQGPSQFPEFGPMQGARPQLVRTSVRCSGQGPVCALYVMAWYVVDWGSSLSFVLTVFSFGFRYFVSKGKESA